MSTIRATDALRLLNLEYDCNLSYQRFNRDIVSGQIPAERSDDSRSWLIDEDQLDSIAARLRAVRPRRTRAAA